MAPKSIRTTSQKIGNILNWAATVLVFVAAGWLYALTTAALLKYLGS